MPRTLPMRRIGDGLTPVDMDGFEFLHSLPVNKEVMVSVTQSRNIRLHRMYYGALQHLFRNQELYTVLGDLDDDVRIALGHFTIETYRGKEAKRPKSLSFAKMDETDFKQFFEAFVKMACERIAPGLDPAALHQFHEILDGNSGKLGQRVA